MFISFEILLLIAIGLFVAAQVMISLKLKAARRGAGLQRLLTVLEIAKSKKIALWFYIIKHNGRYRKDSGIIVSGVVLNWIRDRSGVDAMIILEEEVPSFRANDLQWVSCVAPDSTSKHVTTVSRRLGYLVENDWMAIEDPDDPDMPAMFGSPRQTLLMIETIIGKN